VPASTIQRVVPQLIKSGRAEQLGLGVQIDPLRRLERRHGIHGVIVLEVVPGSPAARAGLHGITQTIGGLALGDVIVGLDDQKVDDFDDLYNALDRHRPGDWAEVKVRRENQVVALKVEVVALP
jgi:S1-C subfamily serine protease